MKLWLLQAVTILLGYRGPASLCFFQGAPRKVPLWSQSLPLFILKLHSLYSKANSNSRGLKPPCFYNTCFIPRKRRQKRLELSELVADMTLPRVKLLPDSADPNVLFLAGTGHHLIQAQWNLSTAEGKKGSIRKLHHFGLGHLTKMILALL